MAGLQKEDVATVGHRTRVQTRVEASINNRFSLLSLTFQEQMTQKQYELDYKQDLKVYTDKVKKVPE